ncbi:hypothetical protein BMI87_17500 [Thioclava sp. F28-4]|nr:hypothetical protein BMI87_17500 [Thioclava sp. F28-4]
MPQEPKSLKPRSRFKVLVDLWKSIDTKTDRLMSLLDLLDWMKQNASDIGARILEALSLMNEELRMLRALRLRQEEAEKERRKQMMDLSARLEAQDARLDRIERKLDLLLRTMRLPMP